MGIFTQGMGMDPFGAISGLLNGMSALVTIAGLVVIGLVYFTASYTLMTIGRKAGERSDWMAYVPIAKDLYRLRFVGAPVWHVLFFGFTGTLLIGVVALLMHKLFTATSSAAFLILGILLLVCYLVVSTIVTFKYYSRYYSSFGFHHMMAMAPITPFLSVFVACFDLYFAYNNGVTFSKGGAMPHPVAAAPAKAPGRGRIGALNGAYKDAVFEIDDMEEIAFGRENPECQVVFDQFDTDISREHCTIRFSARDNTYIVTDHSKNGTFTSEDHRLQPGAPVALPAGTIIFLGNRKNMFRLG